VTSAPGALSVAELRDAFRARRASALELTQACLAGIAARDGAVHGFVSVLVDAALAEARAVDAAAARGTVGPLAGVPVAIKDLLSVRGVGRGNGSPAFAGAAPARDDATVVARLRAAGAVIVGTTHMHELAFGTTGVNPGLGTPVNAWGTDRVPGGSSSGSGAALAAGLVPAALGSDTGGSIRIPASFCGITGLKPTYGRVSRAGATTLAWTLDHVGPMARSARDVALLLQVLAGHDPADPSSARLAVPDYVAALERPLRGVRVGVPRHFCCALLDGEVAGAFEQSLDTMRAEGAVVSDVALPSLQHTGTALGATILAESHAALRPLLGDLFEHAGLEVRVLLEIGKLVTASHYLAAQRLRTRLYEEARAAFARVDLLATPTTVVAAPRIGEMTLRVGDTEIGAVEAIARLTSPWNLTGLPALALPCGVGKSGLPLGLQLVGRAFAEADVLAAGHAYQRATDWHTRVPRR
jgi:aspartyl-tRNA(Asn)/glutamyl-tRNA(Gln) amidotransferase subunit A